VTVFTQINFVADVLQAKCDIRRKNGSGATCDDHLRLIGKRVVDFLFVLIEVFWLGVTAEALRANISSKSIFRFNGGRLT